MDIEQTTYQGAACGYGHNGLRYRANRACVSCTKARSKSAYDKESARLAKARYRASKAGKPKPMAAPADTRPMAMSFDIGEFLLSSI